jgi:hypothetical protein
MVVVTVEIETGAYLMSILLGVKEMKHILRFEVHTSLTMSSTIAWDMTSYILIEVSVE